MSSVAPGGGDSNPYAEQTAVNTGSREWLSAYDKIKADFNSLSGYALNMFNAANDLMPAQTTLMSQIPQLTQDAFGGVEFPFPEGTFAATCLSTNFNDMVSMLNDLHIGMQNTAFAAQTICDSYHLTDVSSSAELDKLITVDGVDFAFGMNNDRPAGLDKRIGQTWSEYEAEQDAKNAQSDATARKATVSDAANPNDLGGNQTVSYVAGPGGSQIKMTTISYSDGSSIVVSESSGGPGVTFTEYQVIGADGKVSSTNRTTTTVDGNKKTVVSSAPDKQGVFQDTGKSVTTTSTAKDGSRVTQTDSSAVENGKSVPTSTETTTEDLGGNTTTTTVTYGAKGSKTTNTEAVGNNDTDTSDEKGTKDPKALADKKYTTFTQVNLE